MVSLWTCRCRLEEPLGSSSHNDSTQVPPTDAAKSFLMAWTETPPFAHFHIVSVDSDGQRKSVGGDTWRVELADWEENIHLAADVVDIGDGTYWAVFVIPSMTGKFRIRVRFCGWRALWPTL